VSASTDYSSKASIGMLQRVPGGYFRKGSRFHPRENPPRNIFVAEFEMAHAPVTVGQYAVFLKSGAAQQKRWWSEQGWGWLNGERMGWGRENRLIPDAWETQQKRPLRPVVAVTCFEAEAYCAWLSYQKKQVVRLPTEDEWEYAARGDDGRPFPWGEEFDASKTNTLESERRDAADVASAAGDVSPFGVVDMAGNVQQWTASEYVPSPGEVFPPGPLRIVRGGSFNDAVFGARTTYRRAYPPAYFYPFLGFRVVISHR